MSDLTIRPAALADRPVLEDLIAACYTEVYPGWYDSDVLAEALPQMLRIDPKLLESGRYFAAHSGNTLAGCGGWSLSAPSREKDAQGTGHIRHFATRPDLMRQGVGSAILKRCMADAKAAGVVQLQCFSSLPGEAFYARHGFERVDIVNIMLGDSVPFSAVLMRASLMVRAH